MSTRRACPAYFECALGRATVVVSLIAVVASVVAEVDTIAADLVADRGRLASSIDAGETRLNSAVDATIEWVVSGVITLVPAEVEPITAYLFANLELIEEETGRAACGKLHFAVV